MIERCSEKDVLFCDMVLNHPSIAPYIRDDGIDRMTKDKIREVLSNRFAYMLKPIIDKKKVGVFLLHPWNFITFEVHSAILPEFRGKIAVKAGHEMMEYMFKNTTCRKIVSHVPFNNLPALALSLKCGLKKEGINRQSFLRDGVIYDQHLVGITKEEWLCR